MSVAVPQAQDGRAARTMLTQAWRERWSDVQWGIRVKTILPRDAPAYPGDRCGLTEVLLDRALLGPAPNHLVLGYLRHSLASQVVSHPAFLVALARFDKWGRPYCSSALVDLLTSFQYMLSSSRPGGRPEEFVQLSASMLHLLNWLLRLVSATFEALEGRRPAPAEGTIEAANYRRALGLAKWLVLESDFAQALLYVGRHEDKEAWGKTAASCKQLTENLKSLTLGFVPDPTALRRQVTPVIAGIKSLFDPGRAHPAAGGSPGPDPAAAYSYVQLIQPAVAYEALLHPTSDLSSLALQLYSLAQSVGMGFPDLASKVVRCALSTLSQRSSFDSLKLDAFVLVRLPALLDRLAGHMRVETAQLRAPTDMYRAFDKILKDEPLLDAVDTSCRCSIVDILLRVVAKCQPPLMTETESADVAKKRKAQVSASAGAGGAALDAGLLAEDVVGETRNFELTLKAESMMDNVLSELDTDSSKIEAMENLLGLLCHIINGESFDRLLAASSANGRLKPFVKRMVKFNQQSQESQGESVKNSLLRAALFDITFLMLVHVVHCFGKELVLQEAQGTVIESWIKDMMLEDGSIKSMQQQQGAEGTTVDTLLQQLFNGDLRTQVVKWQNACFHIHLAFREMVLARAAGALEADAYARMARTACSKLCALPVCVLTWLLGYRCQATAPASRIISRSAASASSKGEDRLVDVDALTDEFLEIALGGGADAAGDAVSGSGADAGGNVMPHARERSALMATILKEMERQMGRRRGLAEKGGADEDQDEEEQQLLDVPVPAGGCPEDGDPDAALSVSLARTWERAESLGRLDLSCVRSFRHLYRSGGAAWFVSSLVDLLLSAVHQDELDRSSDLLVGVLFVDLERCALALLLEVLPQHLLHQDRADRLTDQHGVALAKVAAAVVLAVLVPHHVSAKSRTSSSAAGSKRPASEAVSDAASVFLLAPSAKIRRIMSGVVKEDYIKMEPSAAPPSASSKPEEPAPHHHQVAQATSAFLRLLQSSVQESQVAPVDKFAVRFLEQVVRRGGGGGAGGKGGAAAVPGRSRLVLQHLQQAPHLVPQLVRNAPELFTVGLATQLFDVTSAAGRRNTARTVCSVRAAQEQRKKRE